MPHALHSSLRNSVAHSFRVKGASLLGDPKLLGAYIEQYTSTHDHLAQMLVQELDSELVFPLIDLVQEDPDIASLRQARIIVSEILEIDRGFTSEVANELADALVGGYADYCGLSFDDERTSKRRRAAKKPAKIRSHLPKPPALPKLPRPSALHIVILVGIVALVVGMVVFVRTTQPTQEEVLMSYQQGDMWAVSKATYEEVTDYGYYSLTNTTTTEYTYDKTGNVTKLQGTTVDGDSRESHFEVSYNNDSEGMCRSATKTTTAPADYEWMPDELSEEEGQAESTTTEEYVYTWSMDNYGHAASASVDTKGEGTDQALMYSYGDAGDISSRKRRAKSDSELYENAEIVTTTSFDTRGFPTSQTDMIWDTVWNIQYEGTSTTSYTYEYEYDANGLPSECTISDSNGDISHESYEFDDKGNLIERVVWDDYGIAQKTYAFEYELIENPSHWARQMQRLFPFVDTVLFV